MANQKVVKIDGVSYTVKELTVGDIRKLLTDEPAPSVSTMVINEAIKPFGLQGLVYFTGLTAEQQEELPLSTLQQLNDAAKELNASFFTTVASIQEKFLPEAK